MKIIQFEWKKLSKSKIYFVILLITVAFIAGLFIRNYYYQDIVRADKVEKFQEHASEVIRQFIGDQQTLRESFDGVDPALEEVIDKGQALYGKLQELITAIDTDEHLAALQYEIETYQLAMQYQSLDRRFNLSKVEMEDEIRLNEQLLKKELPKEALNASIQPAIFIKQVVQLLLNTFGFFIILIIIGTPIIREFDDQSIKLSYALPISSTYMILSKWVSISISAISWLILVFISSYGISKLFGKNEINSFDYPLFTKDFNFMTVENYLQQSSLLGLLYVLMLTAFFIFLTFLLKNTLVVQISLLLLFIMNFIMIQNEFVFSILPWSYQELDIAILQQQSLSWIGTLFSILLTGILLFLAIRASKRRDYRV